MELIMNPYWRLTNLYWIRTKMAGHEGKTVVFTPNRVQKKIYQAIEDGWNRIIILKPRKLGITTAVSLYLLDKAMYSPNMMCRTIAHRKQTVTELFNDIARFAFDRIPVELKPEEKYTTRSELEFKGTGSKYSIDVEARGMTPTFLHFSEIAYVDDEGKLEDTLESLPRTACGIAESTANGPSGWFHKTFMDNWQALQNGQKPEWLPLFYAWYDDPNNAMPIPKGSEFFYPDDVEKQRASYKNYDGSELTTEQLFWWDRKKFNLGNRLPELYPSTPEEAFIFSTGRVYPEFVEGLHVIPPVKYENFYVALDWGQTNPLAITLIHQDPDGNFILFDEFYQAECPIEVACKWLKKRGIRKVHYPDPSIFHKNQVKAQIKGGEMGEHRFSIADEFQRHGITLLRGTQNDIPAGIVRVKEYLRFDPERPHPFQRDEFSNTRKGSPRLFITENCKNAIMEFHKYRWPKDPTGALNQEKYERPVAKDDHLCDCIRYTLLSRGKPVSSYTDEPTPRTPNWFIWNRKKAARNNKVIAY